MNAINMNMQAGVADDHINHLVDANKHSILGMPKLIVMTRVLEAVRDVPGNAMELGVYRGGSARLIAQMLPEKHVYLFDSFSGMQHADEVDFHKQGDFADCSEEAVRALLSDCPNAEIRAGWFPQTADGLEAETFAFVHLDGDQYQSTLDALRFVMPKLSEGGVIMLDDYLWPHCPGVKQAMDECFDETWLLSVEQEFQAIMQRVVE